MSELTAAQLERAGEMRPGRGSETLISHVLGADVQERIRRMDRALADHAALTATIDQLRARLP